MNLEFTIKNVNNLVDGEYHGTWSGKQVYVGSITTLQVPKKPRGINVPVVVIVKEDKITIFTD